MQPPYIESFLSVYARKKDLTENVGLIILNIMCFEVQETKEKQEVLP